MPILAISMLYNRTTSKMRVKEKVCYLKFMFTIRYNGLEKIFVCDKKLLFVDFPCQVGGAREEEKTKSKNKESGHFSTISSIATRQKLIQNF